MLRFLWNHKGKVALGLLAAAIFAALFVVCWKVPDALPAIMKFKAFGIHPFGFLSGLSLLSQSAVFAAIGTASAAVAGVLTFGFYKAIEWCCGHCSTPEAGNERVRHHRADTDDHYQQARGPQRRNQGDPVVHRGPLQSSSSARVLPDLPPRASDYSALQPGMPNSSFNQ